jgi:hypothetical protein
MSLLNAEAKHIVEGLIQLVAHLLDFQLLLQQVLLGLQQSLSEFSRSVNITGRSSPAFVCNEPKKLGARSAWARYAAQTDQFLQ